MPLKLIRDGKIWYIRGSLGGRRVRQSTGTDKRALAELQLRKIQRDIEEQRYANKKTVAQAITLYAEKGGERRYLMPILERFGNTYLTDLTPAAVSNFALERFPDHEPSTIKREFYTPLNALMRAAHEAELCPLMRFKPPKVDKKPLVYSDMQWMRTFFDNAHPQIATFVFFISNTAARVTEACNLTLRDVNFDTGYAILRMTKNGKGRSIALSDELLRIIQGWVAFENHRRDRAHTIKRRHRRTPLKNRVSLDEPLFGYAARYSVNQAIERVCDKVNLAAGVLLIEKSVGENGKRVHTKTWLGEPVFPYRSSHQCGRHAFAALLLGEGKSLKFVAEAGGWKSTQIVNDSYGHLERSAVDDQLRQSMSAMVKELGSSFVLPEPPKQLDQKQTKIPEEDVLLESAVERISLKIKDNNGGRCRD